MKTAEFPDDLDTVDTPVTAGESAADGLAAPARPRLRVRKSVGLEGRHRRRRLIRYTFLFISAAFMVNALVGDNGLLTSIKTRREYQAAENRLAALRFENQRLLEDLRRYKSDPSSIEEEARRALGLIKPGEVLVVVK